MSNLAYDITYPNRTSSCVVFSSPHSGRHYQDTFLEMSALDSMAIRSSEDAYVDMLFDMAPRYGAPLLKAGAPRAYIDLNRAHTELDPALIEECRYAMHNNPRVSSGLGVIPRVVGGGRNIYHGKITHSEATERINTYWHPYHTALQTLITRAHACFDRSVLVDCHSMPHSAVKNLVTYDGKCPDIVLGDQFGSTMSGEIVEQIEAAFAAAGFNVTRNVPFAGAYIVQTYGKPSFGQHAVQVEINRSLYMNENDLTLRETFEAVRGRLRQVIARIVQIGADRHSEAAE